ncbi:carboxypeptidase-like regulatory domain-containing protein [Streptomyces microflavus]|uniref:carboxypeptidase-like regulatory domain-containing protein n=1 Tax=Streptomyces microflavus TaxID=1919 RepID=UPI0036C15D16
MDEIRDHFGDWAAVLVSVVAAGIAIWQAVIARQQAGTATKAADLAERQADAAEAQVSIMREELDAATADRLDSWRPRFEASAGTVCDAGQNQPYAEITLTQTAGKALKQVTVEASGQYVDGLRTGRSDDWYSVGTVTIEGMSLGGSPELLHAHFEYRHFPPIRIELKLQCIAREGDHSWVEHITVKAEDAAPAPPRQFRRGRRHFEV